MCRDCHHHAHGAVGPHRRIGLLKIQALLLSMSTGHQTCLVPPIPLDLKDEEAGQRLLPFRQINLLPHPKLHARFQLLINGYPPPASNLLEGCHRRRPNWSLQLPPPKASPMELPTIPRRACRQQHRAALADVSGLACKHAASSTALPDPRTSPPRFFHALLRTDRWMCMSLLRRGPITRLFVPGRTHWTARQRLWMYCNRS
jgi:hypothetical protein